VSEPLTLLCVHPHPDDESIACGGVLARAAATGIRTVVVTCTGGEEGENLAGIELGDEPLPVHRRRELAAALAVLGVDQHHWLGYRDSGMAGSSANDHPDSFHRADVEVAATRLAALLRRHRPQVVVSDDERGTYGHPDHIKAHHVTVRAVELAADDTADVPGAPWRVAKRYVHTLGRGRVLDGHRALVAAGLPSPFGDAEVVDDDAITFGTPDEAVTTEVDVQPWLAAKRAALEAHRSQIGPDSFFLNTPDDLVGPFFGVEQFVLEAGELRGDVRPEPDLFAGVGAADDVALASAPAPAALDPRDPAAFRAVLGRFASGVTVLTSVLDGEPHGMTASSVASLSLDPPLVVVGIGRQTVMADHVTRSGSFALSILGADQAALSTAFADPDRPLGEAMFAGVPTTTADDGSVLLREAIAHLVCRVRDVHHGGDHLLVVGEVVALDGEGDDPLVYYRGRYGRFRAHD
jgi:N-acetyl-1-D-myo-inositol-2-amino-2-deoxy-alpha-D-glucopyranoside deacetylase